MRKLIEMKILKKKFNEIDIKYMSDYHLIELYPFRVSMQLTFDELTCANLGRKYFQIGHNQFRNDFLRNIA